jgi:hypothetical protein
MLIYSEASPFFFLLIVPLLYQFSFSIDPIFFFIPPLFFSVLLLDIFLTIIHITFILAKLIRLYQNNLILNHG